MCWNGLFHPDVISMTNWRRIGLHSQMSMVGSSILLHLHPPLPFPLLIVVLVASKQKLLVSSKHYSHFRPSSAQSLRNVDVTR